MNSEGSSDTEKDDEIVAMTMIKCVGGTDGNLWVLDSGASHHMTSHQEILQNLETGNFGEVKLVHGKVTKVTGKGSVIRKTAKSCGGKSIQLTEVLLVKELDGNLLSVKQMDMKGMCVQFKNCDVSKSLGEKEFLIGRLYCIVSLGSDVYLIHCEYYKVDNSTLMP